MKQVTVPNDPLSKFSLSIFAMNSLLLRSGEMVTKPLGQSSARWHVLGRAGFRPQTVAQMARSIGNSRQSVQRIADLLTEEGLTKYIDNPTDKRAQLLTITPKGTKVLQAIYARDKEWSSELVGKLPSQQLEEIAEALDGIGRILKDYMDTKERENL
jgi:DNA-binding MarR family transcriptional regulator